MRLFVGLDLPWELRQRLAGLGGGIPGARWVPEANFHLTLRFIGEVAAFEAEEIDHALAALRARPFALTLAGMGTFIKGGRDTQIWAGIARNPALDRLHSKVEQAVQRAGMAPERRRFIPHVTLARLDNAVPAKVAAFVQTHNLFRAEDIAVERFCLFSSRLGKEASVYTAEVAYPLT
jgi:2'-5' RNA ligase